MPNDLIVFAVIAGVYFLQWLFKKIAESAQRGSPGGNPEETEEARVRRFLEALGQDPNDPNNRRAAAPVRPAQAPPPVPRRVAAPPPVPQRPRFEPAPVSMEGPQSAVGTRESLDQRVLKALQMLESGKKSSAAGSDAPLMVERRRPASAGVGAIRELLKKPESLRQVFIAQEIFGRPLVLRD